MLTLAALATAVGSVLGGPGDLVYEGKQLSQWLAQTNAWTKPWELTREAADAVSAIGADAVPFLLSEFERGGPIGTQAATALASLGSKAALALPTLARYIDDPKRGPNVVYLMHKTGEAGFPYLLKALSSTNPSVLVQAIHYLAERGKAGEPALPLFIQLMDHPDKWVRNRATLVLGGYPSAAGTNLSALRRALSDSAPDVRRSAASVLGRLGTVAKPAAPDLVRLLDDPDPYCALLASNALAKIDPSALPRSRP